MTYYVFGGTLNLPLSIHLQLYMKLAVFLAPDLFSRCYWVAVFLCGLVMFTLVPAWQCNRYVCLMCESLCVLTFVSFFS